MIPIEYVELMGPYYADTRRIKIGERKANVVVINNIERLKTW